MQSMKKCRKSSSSCTCERRGGAHGIGGLQRRLGSHAAAQHRLHAAEAEAAAVRRRQLQRLAVLQQQVAVIILIFIYLGTMPAAYKVL